MVKKGYKQTEIGVIPMDWEMTNIEDFADIITGGKDTQNKVDDGKYPFYVRSDKVERINSYSFDGEAVITSGDGVGVGKIFHYVNQKFDFHQRVYNIHNFRNYDGKLFYYFFSNHFYHRVMQMTAKSSVDSVRREMISKMKIPLPPTLNEQKAIATALTDIDNLITNLETLITKKKAIKQGAMQQLLTGKKRLKGFTGEWEETELKKLFSFEVGTSKVKYIKKGGRYTIVDMGSVSSDGKLIGEKKTDFSLDILDKGILIMPKDDIGGGNIIGKTAYIPLSDNYILSDHVFKMTIKNGNSLFFSYLINSNKVNFSIKKKVSGSAQLGLSKKNIEREKINHPKDIEEQQAIAQILSDMDTEIEALETQKNKTQHLKQGMMQELLTGKTRLVMPLSQKTEKPLAMVAESEPTYKKEE